MYNVTLIDIPNWIFGSLVIFGIYFMTFGGYQYYKEKIKNFHPDDNHPWIKFWWEVLKNA